MTRGIVALVATPRVKPPGVFEPTVKLKQDGALANARYERMALLRAEGFKDTEIWKACGGSTTDSGSRRYGRRIFQNKVFLERAATLEAERNALYDDPIWGEAGWQINQLYRAAVLEGDTKTMLDAVKMRLRLAENIKNMSDLQKPPPEETVKRGPGAPISEMRQTKRDPAAIKAALLQRNRQSEAVDEDLESA